nr:hypothetical protein [Nostoc sp. DedQUE03]MDZ7971292.1 hypothetical protein [Nostoc sp. DedQUE03]
MKVQGDAMKVQVDATKVQGDATKVQGDATKVQIKRLVLQHSRHGEGLGERSNRLVELTLIDFLAKVGKGRKVCYFPFPLVGELAEP